jgi:hypothetical protein
LEVECLLHSILVWIASTFIIFRLKVITQGNPPCNVRRLVHLKYKTRREIQKRKKLSMDVPLFFLDLQNHTFWILKSTLPVVVQTAITQSEIQDGCA